MSVAKCTLLHFSHPSADVSSIALASLVSVQMGVGMVWWVGEAERDSKFDSAVGS